MVKNKAVKTPPVQPVSQVFRTDFVARTEMRGLTTEEIYIETAESLEHDADPELAIDKDMNTSFKCQGRGKVLRLLFKEVYRITDIEIASNLINKQQIIRIQSNDFITIGKGEFTKYKFPVYPSGNYLDIILNGNTENQDNDIAEVRLYGFSLQSEEDALKKAEAAKTTLVSNEEKVI